MATRATSNPAQANHPPPTNMPTRPTAPTHQPAGNKDASRIKRHLPPAQQHKRIARTTMGQQQPYRSSALSQTKMTTMSATTPRCHPANHKDERHQQQALRPLLAGALPYDLYQAGGLTKVPRPTKATGNFVPRLYY